MTATHYLFFWFPPAAPESVIVGAYPARKRYEIQRRNGEVISVSSEADLELALRQLTPEPVKRKKSRKSKRAVEAAALPELASFELSGVYAILAEQTSQRITEARLMAILADMRMRLERDEEEAMLLLIA